MSKLIAVNDKIVGRIIKVEAKTESGIVLPDTMQVEPQIRCKVISKGNDVSDEINVGDIIFCHKNGGMDIIVDKAVYKILKNDEVYSIFKN